MSAQNIDCSTRKNHLGEAILTSAHNLCFSKTSRKHAYIILTPLNPTFI